jgi:hypothetical protein
MMPKEKEPFTTSATPYHRKAKLFTLPLCDKIDKAFQVS